MISLSLLLTLAPPAFAEEGPALDVATTIVWDGVACGSRNRAAVRAFNQALDAEAARDPAAAGRAYTKALRKDPLYCDAMDNLGHLYRSVGEVDLAIDLYRLSLKVNPQNRTAHSLLATALLIKGDRAGAEAEYRVLTQSDPEYAEGWYGLGMVLLDRGAASEAIPVLESAQRIYLADAGRGGDPALVVDAQYLLGMACVDTGDLDRGRSLLEQALPRFQHGDGKIEWYLSRVYAPSDPTRAAEYAARAFAAGFEPPQR